MRFGSQAEMRLYWVLELNRLADNAMYVCQSTKKREKRLCRSGISFEARECPPKPDPNVMRFVRSSDAAPALKGERKRRAAKTRSREARM